MLTKAHLGLRVNGEALEVAFAPHKTLLEVLREDLALTGTKHGCELGECGACTVLVDDQPVLSCLLIGLECDGAHVRTVEGLAEGPNLSPLQAAFADLGAAQCGYCTPAMLLTAQALLEKNAQPSRDAIKEALSGVLCRCTGYFQIFEAVEEGARRMLQRSTTRGPADVPDATGQAMPAATPETMPAATTAATTTEAARG